MATSKKDSLENTMCDLAALRFVRKNPGCNYLVVCESLKGQFKDEDVHTSISRLIVHNHLREERPSSDDPIEKATLHAIDEDAKKRKKHVSLPRRFKLAQRRASKKSDYVELEPEKKEAEDANAPTRTFGGLLSANAPRNSKSACCTKNMCVIF